MSAAIDLDSAYAERVYAGILGKFIGVYLGRPVEGWAYKDIADTFGLVDHYVNAEVGVPLIVADDDISGTLAFARAVEDFDGAAVGAAEVGKTWLNYIIEDRTILWWGGYGRSTEHTAYLNLKNGIEAPRSGSMERNGRTLAEQIGAQIFSDAFSLMHPGDPGAAAALTRSAASVSHDGVALDAAAFFAAMRSEAFITADLDALTQVARGYVEDPRLLAIIDDVSARIHEGDDWREAREWVDHRYGYARYPGPCHSLSNTAMALASLRLAGEDFAKAVAIASSVGFDTDSNAGTVGCLNGVRLGLRAIDSATSLREPIADRAIVVSADGGEAVTDASKEAARIVNSARVLRGLQPVAADTRFDFRFPGSRHGFTVCPHSTGDRAARISNEHGRALLVEASGGDTVSVSTTTFLDPLETITNFSTLASSTLYPSDTVTVRVSASAPSTVHLYALYAEGDAVVERCSAPTSLESDARVIEWTIPAVGNLVPFRLGIQFTPPSGGGSLTLHSVDWQGAPSAFVQRGILLTSIWDTKPAALGPWVSSARNWEADFADSYCVSHPTDGGVVTIGTRSWTDYAASSALRLSLHDAAGLVVRARGHRNFTAAIFSGNTVQLIDQIDDVRHVLASTPFVADLDIHLPVELACAGEQITLTIAGSEVLSARTTRTGGGGAGFLVERGTFTADGFAVRRIDSQSETQHRKATA